jgi:hypothetical protein
MQAVWLGVKVRPLMGIRVYMGVLTNLLGAPKRMAPLVKLSIVEKHGLTLLQKYTITTGPFLQFALKPTLIIYHCRIRGT